MVDTLTLCIDLRYGHRPAGRQTASARSRQVATCRQGRRAIVCRSEEQARAGKRKRPAYIKSAEHKCGRVLVRTRAQAGGCTAGRSHEASDRRRPRHAPVLQSPHSTDCRHTHLVHRFAAWPPARKKRRCRRAAGLGRGSHSSPTAWLSRTRGDHQRARAWKHLKYSHECDALNEALGESSPASVRTSLGRSCELPACRARGGSPRLWIVPRCRRPSSHTSSQVAPSCLALHMARIA